MKKLCYVIFVPQFKGPQNQLWLLAALIMRSVLIGLHVRIASALILVLLATPVPQQLTARLLIIKQDAHAQMVT